MTLLTKRNLAIGAMTVSAALGLCAVDLCASGALNNVSNEFRIPLPGKRYATFSFVNAGSGSRGRYIDIGATIQTAGQPIFKTIGFRCTPSPAKPVYSDCAPHARTQSIGQPWTL
ncbi:MAG: hypothetical protein WDO70_02485 [Alphaproteobacteria bacterium]